MDIKQRINKFNTENRPFYIVDHENGKWGGVIGSTKQGDNGGWFIRLITFLSMSYLASSNRH